MSTKKKATKTTTETTNTEAAPTKTKRQRKSFMRGLRDDIAASIAMEAKIKEKLATVAAQSDELTAAQGQTLAAQLETVDVLIAAGFEPRIVTKSSPIVVGDIVVINPKNLDEYKTVRGADKKLTVLERLPGKRGRFIVETEDLGDGFKATFPVPISHVVRP